MVQKLDSRTESGEDWRKYRNVGCRFPPLIHAKKWKKVEIRPKKVTPPGHGDVGWINIATIDRRIANYLTICKRDFYIFDSNTLKQYHIRMFGYSFAKLWGQFGIMSRMLGKITSRK